MLRACSPANSQDTDELSIVDEQREEFVGDTDVGVVMGGSETSIAQRDGADAEDKNSDKASTRSKKSSARLTFPLGISNSTTPDELPWKIKYRNEDEREGIYKLSFN